MTTEAAKDHRKAYFAVFGALMLGTILTVVAAKIDLGRVGNVGVGVLIAAVKASLVAMIFMHLKHEERFIYGMVLFPIVLFLVIVFLLMPDVGLAQPTYIPPSGAPGPGH